jgi:hypothetical protein
MKMRIALVTMATLAGCDRDTSCLALVGASVDESTLAPQEAASCDAPLSIATCTPSSHGQFTKTESAGPVCDLACCATPACYRDCTVACFARGYEGVHNWQRVPRLDGCAFNDESNNGACYVMIKDGKVLGARWEGSDAPTYCHN